METNFNFKSQPCTSREQSERLLALGIKKKETADCYYWQECDQYGDPNGKWHLDILNDDTREHFEYLLNHFGICLRLEDALFIPAWSLGRLVEIIKNCDFKTIESERWIKELKIFTLHLLIRSSDDLFENAISVIEVLIHKGYFNKEYLEE